MTRCPVHAADRLRERFGLELSPEQWQELAEWLVDPAIRLDTSRLRYVNLLPRGRVAWQVNLARLTPETSEPLWVLVVCVREPQWIVTVLGCPLNATVREADRYVAETAVRRGRVRGRSERTLSSERSRCRA